ncbi:nitroreductase family protein [[Acholeplasma] multilocale]|uniref:nitroreductase family protein n=1 Tax=[Acholeplasma] multilocale TaxID=264638 RepID=UPI00047A8994|nr:NAD(P)H-dependent oxidoreductase [[Acholeplasma] multilocale]
MKKSVTELMTERHSARKFLTDKDVSEQDLQAIVEAMRMSPASYGMFNSQVIVIQRGEFLNELAPIFYNQPNFVTASAYIILINDNGQKVKDVTIPRSADAIFGEMVDKRDRFVSNIDNVWNYKFGKEYANMNPDEWSLKQSYIALGIGTVAAADLGIDSCAQEGFDLVGLTKVLREKGLMDDDQNIALGLALGYRDESFDKGKVRMPYEEYAKFVK